MKAQETNFSAFVGIDWADTKHDICLFEPSTGVLEYTQIAHRPEKIEDWAINLQKRFDNQPIAVIVELKAGPLVFALMKYAFLVLFPICPMTVAKYRDTFTQSGAKDDPSDAFLMVDFFIHHKEALSPILPDSDETRILSRLVEHRRQLVQEKVRLTNRITQALKNYYPQILDWFEEHDTLLFCDFLSRWSRLDKAKRAREKTLTDFFNAHRVRYKEIIYKRIESIKKAQPLTQDLAVIEPTEQYVLLEVKILHELLLAIKAYDKNIAKHFRQHKDFALFNSFPGAGPVLGPRLLCAMGSNRQRYQSSDELVRLTGIAPVTKRSGKKTWVHCRYSCPKFLRQTFVEWAHQSIRYSYWAKIFYEQQLKKGKDHHAILRSLAFKWARILFRCWINKEPYNEAKYLLSLKAKGSSLIEEQAL